MNPKWLIRLKSKIFNKLRMLKNIFSCVLLTLVFHSSAKDVFSGDTSNSREDAKKHGVWEKKYFLSKKLKSTCEFQNGKRSGTYCKYYKSGFLKISTQYRNNRKDGAKCFYRDRVRFESIKRCIKYENGKKKETITNFLGDI
jgi:antitoxin component YwqK of YwqJK toxin-antitoxin module